MFQLSLRLTSVSLKASTASSAARAKSHWGTRKLHQRQPLPYPIENGLGRFLPPEALKVQLEYQDGLLERLNEQVAGTSESGATIAQTVINLSEKRDKVLAFNYASLALNNSFFLSNLKPPSERYPNYEHEINDSLSITIRNMHGSVQQLRSAFSAAALGTFINGWVWFVSDQAGNTGIITTYGAGTLLVRSRSNMQRHPNFAESDLFDTEVPSSQSSLSNSMFTVPPPPPSSGSLPSGTSPSSFSPGSSGSTSLDLGDTYTIHQTAAGLHSGELKSSHKQVTGRDKSILYAGQILYPLFCVPVYEHAWMSAAFGVWGKEQWLKELWSVVNWQRVDAAYNAVCREGQDKRNNRG